MTRILLRTRFGLPADPWSGLQLDTVDAARAGEMIQAASASQMMVSLLGPRGSGKTRAAWRALKQPGVRVVSPLRLDRERLHLGDIQSALIRDLSDQKPKLSGEARSWQTLRVLGAAQQGGPVVLMIDDAHLLHGSTLRGLKRLRELRWLGVSPLLGIVLVGQSDPAKDVAEVRLRADSLRFAGLSQAEASQALAQTFGKVIEQEAAEALAGCDEARNWLDLQELGDRCLAEAAARGEKRITAGVAAVVMGFRKPEAPEPKTAGQPDESGVTEFLTRGRARKSA